MKKVYVESCDRHPIRAFVTQDCWRHIRQGQTVLIGGNPRCIDAPWTHKPYYGNDVFFTLYEVYDPETNEHLGWRWVQETSTEKEKPVEKERPVESKRH